MHRINRREFLRQSGNAAIKAGLASAILSPALAKAAWPHAAFASSDDLQQQIGAEGTVLLPTNPRFEAFRAGFNRRTQPAAPTAIVLCLTASAVSKTVLWARENNLAVRMRSGGHSPEGFSQGPGVVIDTRSMNDIQVDARNGVAAIGAGSQLGGVYERLYRDKLTIPAGSCPSVGIAGLTTGGGFGLLSRKLGLTCDQLLSLQIVTAQGAVLNASPSENPDLFWACRGGGGGSFGVVTQFNFRLNPIDRVKVFTLEWPGSRAQRVIEEFQDWASVVADELTCHLVLLATPAGPTTARIGGQFVGTNRTLNRLLRPLLAIGGMRRTPRISDMSFISAVHHFSGASNPPRVFFKSKSDFMKQPLSREGIRTLIRSMPLVPGAIAVSFDNYGGAINRVPRDATAFFHRENTIAGLHYFSEWQSSALTPQRLSGISALYAAMRPHMSGGAYFNYCDRDLPNWQEAYWGTNFARLSQIKRTHDPDNLFNHPQSIPVG